jgi:hypothetical protein
MPTPEQQARDEIDRMLDAAGWVVQNAAAANLSAGGGGEPRVGHDRGGTQKVSRDATPIKPGLGGRGLGRSQRRFSDEDRCFFFAPNG